MYRSTLVKLTNQASDYTNIMTIDLGRKSSDIIRDANITGTGIAFVDGGGGADTITDTGGGFVTAGFVAGGFRNENDSGVQSSGRSPSGQVLRCSGRESGGSPGEGPDDNALGPVPKPSDP